MRTCPAARRAVLSLALAAGLVLTACGSAKTPDVVKPAPSAVPTSATASPAATATSTGAGAGAGAPSGTPTPPETGSPAPSGRLPTALPAASSLSPRQVLVTLSRSGGLTGRTTQLTVRGDGSTTATGRDRSLPPPRTLSPTDLARLETLLASPALAAEADRSERERITVPRCPDAFRYVLVWEGGRLTADACGTASAYPTFRQVLRILGPLLG